MSLVKRLIGPLILVSAVFSPLTISSQSLSNETRSEIEELIRNYLLDNPEIIFEAAEAYQIRQEAAQLAALQSIFSERSDEIYRSPDDPFIGDPEGTKVLVEFFDYSCGYCKRVADDIMTLSSDDDVKVVFKEFPILGPTSMLAAKVSLAAHRQGKYKPFHFGLFNASGPLTEDRIWGIAEESGLDVDQARSDMDAPEIQAVINRNYELAQALGINGTPAFVAGTEIIPGVIPLDQLRSLLNRGRRGE